MKLLVTGGRDFADRELLEEVLDELLRERLVGTIIHGAATGADELAGRWAKARGIPQSPFPVSPGEWKAYGRIAGSIRNQRMLTETRPDLVVAFPGGSGTRDMVRRARAAGVEVRQVKPRGNK